MLTSWTQRDSLLARPPSSAAPHAPAGAHGAAGAERADLLLLANGLQRLLANCEAQAAERHFPGVLKAHRALRVQLRLHLSPSLPAQVLSDLCHEIAEVAEPAVRQAALRCLHRAALRAAASAAPA